MTNVEQWSPIAGFEDSYEVSNHGHVRSLPRTVGAANGKTKNLKSRPLPGYATKSGHRYVDLYCKGIRTKAAVHRLVLEAFVGPCPAGLEGCHRNDDPADNRLENLYWGTRSDNLRDAVRNGKHAFSKRDRCGAGHEYTPETLFIRSKGERGCRICDRRQKAEYKARKRAEASA